MRIILMILLLSCSEYISKNRRNKIEEMKRLEELRIKKRVELISVCEEGDVKLVKSLIDSIEQEQRMEGKKEKNKREEMEEMEGIEEREKQEQISLESNLYFSKRFFRSSDYYYNFPVPFSESNYYWYYINCSLHYLNHYLLILSSYYGHIDIIELLIKKGVNVNCKSKHGNFALIEAAKNGRFGSTRMLLKYGAKVDLEDKYGCTALMRALTSNKYFLGNDVKKITNLLIDYGANINHKNSKGETALTIVQSSNKEALMFLLEKGAIIDRNSSTLKNLFDLVIEEGNLEEQKHLLNLVLLKEKKLNVELLFLMYKQSFNCSLVSKNFFIENLLENINIYNLFTLNAFTFQYKSLLISSFLDVIELYKLTNISRVKDIKIEIIELFFRYYEEKTDRITGYEDRFICKYNHIKNEVYNFVYYSMTNYSYLFEIDLNV